MHFLKKKEYRKYNIKSVADIDDFASIKEVVHRRYKRLIKENIRLPDLILIDGGKGQLNMALSALEDLGVGYIPIIGLAKRLEEVFIPGNSEPQSIHKQSPGLILLRRIRDEAHRFAITTHRAKRAKGITKSLLDQIQGIGLMRKRALLNHFGSARAVESASLDDLKSIEGIEDNIANKIYNYFHE